MWCCQSQFWQSTELSVSQNTEEGESWQESQRRDLKCFENSWLVTWTLLSQARQSFAESALQ